MAQQRILEGKLAIVTGGSRGIGEAIARNLAAKGAHVVLNYVSASSKAAADALAAELRTAHGVRATAVQTDVALEPSDEGAPATGADLIVAEALKLVKDLQTTATAPQIDILVNNAGIAVNSKLPEITAAQLNDHMRVNVYGPVRLVQAALPYLPQATAGSGRAAGRIVNISSVSSTAGFVGQSCYGGSKAALEAMTRSWARELADRATVNAINPGPVEGPMYAANPDEVKANIRPWIEHAPLMAVRPGVDADDVVAAAQKDPLSGGGRPARTSEIAGIVGMLCTPDSAWCTGQVVSANGGMMMN